MVWQECFFLNLERYNRQLIERYKPISTSKRTPTILCVIMSSGLLKWNMASNPDPERIENTIITIRENKDVCIFSMIASYVCEW
jgi:TRAP-type C4-dicarboxylate transport system permease large subunit